MSDVVLRVRYLWVVLLLMVLPGVRPAMAQVDISAPLKGVVTDPEGKAVVNATVLVRSELSASSADFRTTTTDAAGRFAVAGLLAGTYTIEVAVPGFDLIQRNGIV